MRLTQYFSFIFFFRVDLVFDLSLEPEAGCYLQVQATFLPRIQLIWVVKSTRRRSRLGAPTPLERMRGAPGESRQRCLE